VENKPFPELIMPEVGEDVLEIFPEFILPEVGEDAPIYVPEPGEFSADHVARLHELRQEEAAIMAQLEESHRLHEEEMVQITEIERSLRVGKDEVLHQSLSQVDAVAMSDALASPVVDSILQSNIFF
jgi:hypothetical protein